jgi:hypothetical protein
MPAIYQLANRLSSKRLTCYYYLTLVLYCYLNKLTFTALPAAY